MLKKLLHVGISGNDFDRMVERFKGFGLECSQVMKNEELGASLAFVHIGDTMLELICHVHPPKGDYPVVNVVTGQKGAINHLCFEVDNLEESIGDFERSGAKLVKGCPRQGAHGRVAFFYPETTEEVLIELCEVAPDRTT